MTELRDALMEIHGIGESKADAILEVIRAHGSGGNSDNVREAYEHIQAGHPGIAEKFLRRELGEE